MKLENKHGAQVKMCQIRLHLARKIGQMIGSKRLDKLIHSMSKMKSRFSPTCLAFVGLGTGTILLWRWIYWSRHGVEFTDEGLYLLAAQDPWKNTFATFFGFLLHPLFLLSRCDLGLYRVLALVLLVGIAGILAISYVRFLQISFGWVQLASATAIISASLLVFSDGRRTPGYDYLVLAGALVAWAGYFSLRSRALGSIGGFFLLSSGLIICAFGKWVVALLLLVIFLILLGTKKLLTPRKMILWASLLALGLVASISWIGVEAMRKTFTEAGCFVWALGSHGTKLIPFYGATLINFVYRCFRAFLYGAPLLLFCAWAVKVPKVRQRLEGWAWFFACGILIVGVVLGLTKAGASSFSRVGSNVAAELLWLIAAALIFCGIKFWKTMLRHGAEGACLVGTPFILGVGTATALGDYAGHGAVFFVLAGIGIWAALLRRGANPRIAEAFLWVSVCLNFIRLDKSLQDQFRTQPPWTCNEEWKITESGPLVYLDKDQAKSLQVMRESLARLGFRAGDPIIAIGDLPGAVYLLGGWSPGTCWYFAGTLGQLPYCKAVVSLVSSGTLQKSFFLFRKNSPLYPERGEILRLAEQPNQPDEVTAQVILEREETHLAIWHPMARKAKKL